MLGTMMQTILMVLGQAGAPANAASLDAVKVQSVWDFVVKGGPVMIPIGLCSLVALTVIVERLASLRRRIVIPGDVLPGVTGLLSVDGGDREKALDFCKANGSPLSNVLAAGIKRLGEPVELLERHIQEAGQREASKLRKFLRLLSVLASIAPLLGLLGTIFGMINAFQTVAASGEALGKTELLAKGIYEAMITTAAGLMVAIPVILAYHWLAAKVENLVAEMDRMTVDFVEAIARPAATRLVSSTREKSVRIAEETLPSGDGRMAAAVATV